MEDSRMVEKRRRAECEALIARIAKIAALSDALDREELACIRRFDELSGWNDQGAMSCAHWLTWRIGLSPGAAREKVRVAKALGRLPKIDAALGKAKVSYSKVRAMTRVATLANEEQLLELARHSTAGQLEKLCRAYGTVVDPTSLQAERFLRRTDLESGMVRITLQCLPEEAALVQKALEAATEAAYEKNTRSPTFTRTDAFVAVCESFLATKASESTVPSRFEVAVHVPAETLADAKAERIELEDGTRVSEETARRLSCDAPVVELLEAADGTVLDVGRRTRRISTRLRRALEERDKCCQFPGCSNKYWVDAHHVEHWADGGETAAENLVLVCRHHHRLVHEGGFRVEKCEGGFRFLNPWGDEVVEVPEAPEVSEDVVEQVRSEHEELDEAANFPLWDGTRMDYGLAVDVVLAAEGRS